MKLNGKCKKDFEKWYLWIYLDLENVSGIAVAIMVTDFYTKKPSEQYGVYVDFFISVGYIIRNNHNEFRITDCNNNYETYQSDFILVTDSSICQDLCNIESINKANELFNNK